MHYNNQPRSDNGPEWWLPADWPAPAQVRAGTTLRRPGLSQGPYAEFNLATHVGDAPQTVAANRQQLAWGLDLPVTPVWLEQIHSTLVVDAALLQPSVAKADAAFTRQCGIVCAVLTADCLPVLLCSRDGECIAAVHAGWRGLAAGIIEATLAQMGVPADNLLAWLGPAIGPSVYEVGEEVRQACIDKDASATKAFRSTVPGKWLANLYALARQQLLAQGVSALYGGDFCTFSEAGRFYSYRRDGCCGRMASLIWRTGK